MAKVHKGYGHHRPAPSEHVQPLPVNALGGRGSVDHNLDDDRVVSDCCGPNSSHLHLYHGEHLLGLWT